MGCIDIRTGATDEQLTKDGLVRLKHVSIKKTKTT
jgi:hypothetical protein